MVLPTMMVKLYVGDKYIGTHRALCDTGSHLNIVHHKIVKRFYDIGEKIDQRVNGIGNEIIRLQRKLHLSARPWFSTEGEPEFMSAFMVLPRACDWSPVLPSRNIANGELNWYLKPTLADPNFWQSSKLSVLLGVEFWGSFMNAPSYELSKNMLRYDTMFGNVILGKLGDDDENVSQKLIFSTQKIEFEELNKSIQRLWDFSDLDLCTKKDADHELAEKIFQKEHTRDKDGRFIVPIPLKPNVNELGSNKAIALKRFRMLEQRFKRNPTFKENYVKFMREYIEVGHMVLVDKKAKPGKWTYHLPHHGVVTSEKFRVVFDAGCITDEDISLNDAQLVGEKLQRDLPEIVMRFRRFKVAVSADVKQMFRQVEIDRKYWDLQRVFWRENEDEPIKEYWLTTVTYGLASSPHSAVRTLIEGAKSMEETFPKEVFSRSRIVEHSLCVYAKRYGL